MFYLSSKDNQINLQEALRVFPAVTRLTVYRRLSVTRPGYMWRDREANELIIWRRNFEQCENSVTFPIASSVFVELKNIFSDGWLSLDVQVMEIWRSKPETKVDDESVILTKFLTSCKIHPGSIQNHFLGWKMVGESEFDFKIVRGSTQYWKLFKLWAGTPNIWERPPGAHNRISPDHYFEYVETSGWDTAPWS